MSKCNGCVHLIICSSREEKCQHYQSEADILHEFEEWLKNQIAGIDNNGISSKNQILVVRQDRWAGAVEVYLKEMENRIRNDSL